MGHRSRGRVRPREGEIAARRTSRLRLEPLEPRLLLSAAVPTAYDQYLLELVNRARADPAAEAARLGISLNEGLDPGTLSSDPRQPLAMNPCLLDSARQHTAWMLANDTLSHTGAGGSDPGDRMAAADYDFVPPWSWGENLAYFRQTPTAPPMASGTAQLHRNLFVDGGVDGRGHRINLLDPDFKEVGTAVLAGDWGGWNAIVCTEDFAMSGEDSFLTGVAYDDHVTHDDFYTPGEGLGAVTIVATRLADGAQFTTTTWASGGYSLALPAGTYDVLASGGGLGAAVAVHNVAIGQLNVKQDFLPGMAPAQPDLEVASLAAPDGDAGAAIAVDTTVRNSGELATGSGFTVSYYLSADSQWDAGDSLLAATESVRPALGAGQSDSFTAQVTLPRDAEGPQFIIAFADWTGTSGSVAESDEANNTRAAAVTIQNVGLFQAPWPASPSAVPIGQPFAFDFSSTCEGQPGAAYGLVSGPSWLTLDAETGLLSGTPTRRADIGSTPVTLQVSDGLGGTDEYTFDLAVQGQIVVLNHQAKATFIDATGDRVTVSLVGRTGTVYLVRAVTPGAGGVYSNSTPGDLYSIEAEGTTAATGISFTAAAAGRGQAPRTSVGDVIVEGSLGSFNAPMMDLQGDLTVTGGIGRLTLRDVGSGSADASPSLSIGSDPAILSTTLVFGRVRDATLDSETPIKALTVTEWIDADGTPDAIAAPWLGALTTKGRKANPKLGIAGLAGDFEADLALNGGGSPKQTLAAATIAGQLTGGVWDIEGATGAIKAAATQSGWSLDATGIVKSLEGTAALAGTVQARAIAKVTTKGVLAAALTLTGNDGKGVSLGTLKAGRAGDATVAAPNGIASINVVSWQAGSISAAWIGTLSATGASRLGLPGDFGADLDLTAAGNPRQTLGKATIAGTLADATWTVSGIVGTLTVGRWGAGSIVAVGVAPGNDGVYLSADDQLTGGQVNTLTIRQFDSSYTAAFGLTADELGKITLAGKPLPLRSLPFSQGDFRLIYAADALHKGVALPLWDQNVNLAQLRTTLDHLKALGVNWVEINVFWFQDDVDSTAIAPDFGLWSASDASVRTVIDEVHRRGMKVMLKPVVDLANDPSHWRGQIAGSDAWFTDAQGYDAFIAHWAGIASEKGVEMLCIGTELSAASAREAPWRALIANVRAAYSGQLVYAANQGDATHVTWENVAWWDALDYIGLDAYYPLTNKTDPTPAELDAAWATRAAMIETWHNGLSAADQKPILFTEAGYRSWDGANMDPSSTSDQGDTNVDLQEQADCYTALFDTLWRQKSWFTGVFWWNWEVDPNPTWEAANWYTPQGKPAEAVLQLYYA